MPRRPIIAVVGGNGVGSATANAAERVGRAITGTNAILLTGSQPNAGSDVKRAAMRGAMSAERNGLGLARLIGVLPAGEKPITPKDSTKWLIETGLESSKRNPITGMTLDAMVVFEGGAGTLAELAFALAARKPVMLVGAVASLRSALADPLEFAKLKGNIRDGLGEYNVFVGQHYTEQQIEAELSDYLRTKPNSAGLPPSPGNLPTYADDTWARTLVHSATMLVPTLILQGDSDFPGTRAVTPENFNAWLAAMP